MVESSPRPPWDMYFMGIVQAVSTRADCRRRQVGTVIVDADHRILSTGYNGTIPGRPGCLSGACPRGLLSDEEAKTAPKKDGPDRCIAVHAEVNALLNARQSVKGATAYVNKQPCFDCDNALRAAGIERIVYPSGRTITTQNC